MPDEGLQEIQLRGKQLVFLAMSATVVAVVIFLCGVMVGRGVPTPRQALEAPIGPDPDALAPTPETGAPPVPGELTDNAGTVPAPLEYPELVSDQPPADRPLKPSEPARPFSGETAVARVETPRRVPTVVKTSTGAPAATSTATASKAAKTDTAVKTSTAVKTNTAVKVDTAARPPATAGTSAFQVQVAAYQREGDATTVRDRLARKGYPAFVATAATPAGTWFRVRVGGYETRDEAQAIATRLKREEQLEPWVTR